MLLGLVFLGVGLGTGYFFVLSDLRTWLAARDFVPVQAELLHVDLKHSRGSKSATTYQVQARYRYSFAGRDYTGERVTIGEGSDNIGSYHQDFHAQLRTAKKRRTTVTAWVNPENPGEALLDRDMRWGLLALKSLFFFLFTPIGLAVSGYALRSDNTVNTRTPARTPAAPPDGRIISGSRKTVWGYWGFALLWNVISLPIFFILPAELTKQNWAALLGLLFPVAGLWLFYRAVHKTLEWRRFGALVLTLNPATAATGGVAGGAIELPERFRNNEAFRITLTCVHRRRTGQERNISEKAVWQDEARVHPEPSGRGSRVSFRFTVPADLPPSTAPSDDYHAWQVHLHADLPGIDLDHKFDVPMSATGGMQATNEAELTAAATAVLEIPARVVRIERTAGGIVFYYPLFRYPALGFALLVISLIFGSSTTFLYHVAGTGLPGIIAGFMALVFGLFTVGLALLALYCLANTLRVEISPRGLTSTRRFFGIPSTTHLPLDEITAIEPRIGSQSNNGNDFHVRYALNALRRNGRRVPVGDDIPGRPLAEHLARLVREACGIVPSRR